MHLATVGIDGDVAGNRLVRLLAGQEVATNIGTYGVDRYARRTRHADLEFDAVAQPEPRAELRERSSALLDVDGQGALAPVDRDRQRLRSAALGLGHDGDLVTVHSTQLHVARNVVDRE